MSTPQDNPFKCSKCGLCCKNISNIPECEHLDNGNGVCKYYDEETKLCKIYEFRPEICNVALLWERRYKSKKTWDEFLEENYEGCRILQELEKNKK